MASDGAIQNSPFHSFVDEWFVGLQHCDNELQGIQSYNDLDESDLKILIDRVLAHYSQYYEEKKHQIHRDVFQVLKPTWFTSVELAGFSVSDWKPTLDVLLINKSVTDLTDDQRNKICLLKETTKQLEGHAKDQVRNLQESISGCKFLAKVKRIHNNGVSDVSDDYMIQTLISELKDDDYMIQTLISELKDNNRAMDMNDDYMIQTLISMLTEVVISMDNLRKNTMTKVIQILDSKQSVQLLAAKIYRQVRMRSLGLEVDRQERSGLNLDINIDWLLKSI